MIAKTAAALDDQMWSVFRCAAKPMLGLDADGRILCINPAACSLFGRSEDSLLGQHITVCVPGLTDKAMFEMFKDEHSYYHGMDRIERRDLYGTRRDTTLFPLEMALGVTGNDHGIAYVCTAQDVTDERAALAFTELYERALACSQNGVFIVDANRDQMPLVYVNEALLSLYERPLHLLLGSPVGSILGTLIGEEGVESILANMRNGHHADATVTHTMSGGGQKVLEFSISPVRGDQGILTHFIGIILDVTARVQAEKSVAERSAQLNAVFSLSSDGLVMFDAQDKLVFVNPSLEMMLGFELGQLEHMSFAQFEQQLLAMCDESLPMPSLQGSASDGAWEGNLHLVRPQHRVVHASSRRNEAGRRETIIYFRDITHEDAVDRMKSEFLASAAHELRTPMVSIFGFTELLLRRKYPEERQADMLQTIHRQSGLLVKMINELLDLARIEARRGLDMHIEGHSLQMLVENSVKGLMRSEGDRQVALQAMPQVEVMVDIEKMQLALANLLGNAFKYSPNGGVVSLEARVESKAGNNFAVVSISDEGIGMKPDQLARAFERFYRADASGNIPGTGLGLSLVREIAELHKGHIELASTYGKGTTATLWIPLAETTKGMAVR